MTDAPKKPNLFFTLAIAAGALFAITIFALVAIMFGDGEAPVSRFLNEHGGRLIVGEVTATLLLGWLAMAVDRRRILRDLRDESSAEADRPESSDH